MSGLQSVREVRVPRAVVEEAHAHLRAAGADGYEGMALWAGEHLESTFLVRATLVPRQTGHRGEDGVCVAVDGDELHRINVWLYEHKLTLVAQLHSHPTAAYHSETDDTFPIVAAAGGLSLVVPDFAVRPFNLAKCAVYRLLPPKGWLRLKGVEVQRLIHIVDD